MEERLACLYSNSVNITSSIYDFSFSLRSQSPDVDQSGSIMQSDGKPVIKVDEEVIVRMSPQHAKAFASLLVKQIIDYEKQYNIELPLPPELKKLWEEIFSKK